MMKTKTLFAALLLLAVAPIGLSQIKVPQPSPFSTFKQVVGVTSIEVAYSRPSIKGRTIFGALVPYNTWWRTGANANTTISFSDDVVFGGENVPAGKYAIYTKPSRDKWEVALYSDTSNWGLPKKWDESKVVAKVKVQSYPMDSYVFESFEISISDIKDGEAMLNFLWEHTAASVKIEVPTDRIAIETISKTMATSSPSKDDYTAAARYYFNNEKGIDKAKEWIDKAAEMYEREGVPFWFLRLQSQIYAKIGKKKKAIKMAKKSMELAEKAGNRDYVNYNKMAIEEWSK